MKLCWLRTDLRVRDNPALYAAMESGPVVCLYIATPEQWRRHGDAPVKLDFWRRNLKALENRLSGMGIPLLYCQVKDYAAIPRLIEEIVSAWSISALYFNAEYPLNEKHRDEMVVSLCVKQGIKSHVYHDQVMIQPGAVLNGSGEPFKVFTPFSRKCRTMIHAPGASEPPGDFTRKKVELARVSGQCRLADIDWPEAETRWETLWPAGEDHGRQKLKTFCDNAIREYKARRDFPAIDGTSTLSPWLSAGVVSVLDCWCEATATHQGEGPETWKNELLWREFYKHIMFHYPRVSMNQPFRQDYRHIPWRDDDESFRRWCQGETGIPIIDAAMHQLLETGWMHNRLRMVTAMFLTKHLLIDWRRGEQWFMQHLVDGDFSANNGGWQWSASTGTDAVPYFRVFNPVTQSRRFDETGSFIRHYLPALRELDNKSIHEPGLLKPASYPSPLIDLKIARQRALDAYKR